MNLRKLKVLFVILILTLSLTACKDKDKQGDKNGQDNKKQERVYGGEVNIPLTHVKAVNPLINGSSSFYYFNKLIFEGLFEFNGKLEPKERLVESYNINSDNSIDLSLKDNVLWHDGKKLTTEDVKFTIETIKYGITNGKYATEIADMYKPEGILDISKISDVEIKDDKNMLIHFSQIDENTLERLTFPIISAKALDNDYEKALDSEKYTPIGTGPYKQEEYEKLKYVKLKANEDYWGEKPHIEIIKARILKDEELALTSFESGQVDLVFSLGTNWEKYSQDEKVNIHQFPSRGYEFLAINSKSSVFQDERGKEVKRAIAHAINRDSIISKIYQGHATKTNTPVNPKSYLTNDEINSEYKYDLKKAKSILEKAGYSDTNEEGIYRDENNNKLSVKLSTNSYNESRVRTLDMIAEDLKAVGIEVEKDYENINTEALSEEEKQTNWDKFESKINSGNFEIALVGWETSFMPDIAFMFHSSSDIGTRNFIGYENLELDKALEDIKNSKSSARKKENYIKAQKIIVEDLPYVSLFYTNGAILSNKKINGDINPVSTNIYNSIDKWFIPKQYHTKTE